VNDANGLKHRYESRGYLKLQEKAIELLLTSKRIARSTSELSNVKILANIAQTLHLQYEALRAGPVLIEAIINIVVVLRTANKENDTAAIPVVLSE
jgi:hypothetical protein